MVEADKQDEGEDGGLPLVADRKQSNLGLYVFLILLVLGGAWIFSLMSATRADLQSTGPTLVDPDPNARIVSPPPLALPPAFLESVEPARRTRQNPPEPANPRVVPPPAPAPAIVPPRTSVGVSPPPAPIPTYEPPSRPSVVFDSAFSPAPAAPSATGDVPASRVTAGQFANPSYTIPQGTVIPAVLETALDSTRPGGVRALVQLDIGSFDGSRVLIHRGSRLYGEYEADLQAGQKRANIRWTRLIRPDGVTIALDSPASDPLGRAGVKGDVDSKFFQRFGGALLQSILDIGVGVAAAEATGGVVVALPGSTQNVRVQQQQQVTPTLKVRHGTSVSVFVARDLDFSTVGT